MSSQEAASATGVYPSQAQPAVRTEGLSKRYGKTQAVRELDLTVAEGTIFGLLGPNGAGKTTTMRMLLGLVWPTAGTATVLGLPCRSVEARRAGLVGAFIEGPAFYPYLSGRENLTLLCDLSGRGHREVDWAIEAVRMTEHARRPYGTYSHGMRQRLGIAAALVPRPRLLILDEPAAGLDPAGVREVRALLAGLVAEGVTILLSSHLLPEVQLLCTHVGIMFRGRMVACGTVPDLLGDEVTGLTVVVDDPVRARQVIEAAGHEVHEPARPQATAADGELTVEARAEQVPEINAALVQAGLRVFQLSPRRRTLEDLYMHYAERVENA